MMIVGRAVRQEIEQLDGVELENIHLQTVGMKIWTTERGVRDVEIARLSCGGHGA